MISRRWATRLWIVQLLTISLWFAHSATAQVVAQSNAFSLTTEAFGNLTAGASETNISQAGQSPDSVWVDAGARVLARLHIDGLLDVGVRLSGEAENSDARIAEASVLVLSSMGRLEFGKRMGLPDVLVGYAPNEFTFTTAEFGPASGRSLDPGGGLQTVFLRSELRARVETLAMLGVAASQFADQSLKIIYVSPKRAGWLAGASYSNRPDDARFEHLVQSGLVHETYWQQNVWRWGGSFSHADAAKRAGEPEIYDLNSYSFGTSVVIEDALLVGIAASYDGHSGLLRRSGNTPIRPTWGMTTSINYNTGPWTLGGYYQYATSEDAVNVTGSDQLRAFEVGASYRFTTRLRLYASWYRFHFTDDGRSTSTLSGIGDEFNSGFRVTL